MSGKAQSSSVDAYRTPSGVSVHHVAHDVPIERAIEPVVEALDQQRGVLLTSNYEYPGRYVRHDIAFINPPLCLESSGRRFRFTALNDRGRFLLPIVSDGVRQLSSVVDTELRAEALDGSIAKSDNRFTEEERSRQPSIFSVLRSVIALFASPEDAFLGLYGAFGYDLVLQFEPLRLRQRRPSDQRDLVLYLPDELVVVDHRLRRAVRHRYEFTFHGASTEGMPRTGGTEKYSAATSAGHRCDHEPGEYAAGVRVAREAFRRGDLFEVVPSQTFFAPCPELPSTVFRRLSTRNPSPYGFFINLGRSEYLIGASPEMYVRVTGGRVETCPIAGTIARGTDAMGDASQIVRLLASGKDESELTMCTDVDRNDKSRICAPGSVRVIGRRQIEMYSRLIHTVDHVEGRLREPYDALDAFLTHTWAVTVTGAPKLRAMQFLEDQEKSPRAWYGGAVGMMGFDGNMNTGLTLRTMRIRDGVAEVRAGATLLWESSPDDEERETRLKAEALLDAIHRPQSAQAEAGSPAPYPGTGKRVLLVDHQDSFVHTLANYLRQTGAEVLTWRTGFSANDLAAVAPDLLVLSPGPGIPSDFDVGGTLASALAQQVPVFGVCLGLQGIVEYFGGELAVLSHPVHGKPSQVRVLGGRLFQNSPSEFTAGRYHSICAVRDTLPADLRITAESEDGVIMAIEHIGLPVAAVQFHPESILTLEGDVGCQLVRSVVEVLCQRKPPVSD